RPSRARGARFLDRKVEASLKLRYQLPQDKIIQKIPRPKGRGLIEASTCWSAWGLQLAIPRPKGRGLIEAIWAMSYRVSQWAIPRPKGRGLIEAERCGGCCATTARSIPRPKGRGLIEARAQS